MISDYLTNDSLYVKEIRQKEWEENIRITSKPAEIQSFHPLVVLNTILKVKAQSPT